MLVNECSLYRHSKPFSSILSKEQEEVAFQVLNCLRASAQSSLRNSHRILNYYYWAFFSLQELRFLTWPMLFLHRRVGFAVPVLGEQPNFFLQGKRTAAWGTFKCCKVSAEPTSFICSADNIVQTDFSTLQDEPKENLEDPEEVLQLPVWSVWRKGFGPLTTTDLADISSLCSAEFRLSLCY